MTTSFCCLDHQMGNRRASEPCGSAGPQALGPDGKWQPQLSDSGMGISVDGGMRVFVVKGDFSCHGRGADGQMVPLALSPSDGERIYGERDPWQLLAIFTEILARELPKRA
jgi:hypothetical protein